MRRNLVTIVLAVLGPSTMYYAFAASVSDEPDGPAQADTRLLASPSIDAMPAPLAPFDETPITPVESAGAPMWP